MSLDKNTIELVEKTWAMVVPIAPTAAGIFYHNLFKIDPSVKALFKGDMEAQGKKLVQMIGAAVGKLNDLDTLVPILENLGKRHVDYGVKEAHYTTVGNALIQTLEQGLGDAFTVEAKSAWKEVYGVMASTMFSATVKQ